MGRVSDGPRPQAPLGVVMLDHELVRPPGDVGNPDTFPFPTLHRVIKGVTLERLLNRDPAILADLITAGRELEEAGAWGIASGCGFFVIFQAEVASALGIPVFLSSLIQIPFVQQTIGPESAVGVLTAHSGRLTRDHIVAAGALPETTVIVGLEDKPAFSQGVLISGGEYDRAAMEREIILGAKELAAQKIHGRAIGALVFECTNLPPFARAVQAALGLPIYDSTTLIKSVRRAVFRKDFQGDKG